MLPRRRFQFSLRTLLVGVTLFAVFFGWFGSKLESARRQRAAVEKIMAAGGAVIYDYEYDANENENHIRAADYHDPSSVPAWLESALGRDFFATVVEVRPIFGCGNLLPPGIDRMPLGELPALRNLYLPHYLTAAHEMTDDRLFEISKLQHLEFLYLRQTQITGHGLRDLPPSDTCATSLSGIARWTIPVLTFWHTATHWKNLTLLGRRSPTNG